MSARLTPGQKALREAARLEAARVYGGVVTPNGSSATTAQLEAELAAALKRSLRDRTRATAAELSVDPDEAVRHALRDGWAVSQVMDAFGLSYAEVRLIRKQLMTGEAVA